MSARIDDARTLIAGLTGKPVATWPTSWYGVSLEAEARRIEPRLDGTAETRSLVSAELVMQATAYLDAFAAAVRGLVADEPQVAA